MWSLGADPDRHENTLSCGTIILRRLRHFLFGGVVIGAAVNFKPLYAAPLGLFLLLVVVLYIFLDAWFRPTGGSGRHPLKSFYFYAGLAGAGIVTLLAWLLIIRPIVEAEEIKTAIRDVAVNTGKCEDLGRKEALEFLSEKGRSLKYDLDCADLVGISLSSHADLGKVSMAGADAHNGNFSGADINGAILSGTNFTGANLTNASLAYSVVGRHLLFDKKTGQSRCFLGADLTNAKLENTDFLKAYLVGVRGLTCEQLRTAKNWPETARDKELACEALIPELPLYEYIRKWPQKCE